MFKPTKLALSISAVILSALATSQAFAIDAATTPDISNAAVTYGSATLGKVGSNVTVDASGSTGVNGNTLINWGGSGFNVGKDASVNFTANSNNSIILNNDTSGKLSVIDGNINANQGNIVIVNPNGIEHTGGGNARLSLIAGEAATDNFGLDKSDSRIEVTFDQTDAKISSNIENMTPGYESGALNIQAAGQLQLHTNAQTLNLFGDGLTGNSALNVVDSKLAVKTLNLYGLGMDKITVKKADEPLITVTNSEIIGTDTDYNANTVNFGKRSWSESTSSYSYDVDISGSQLTNVTTSINSYGAVSVDDSTFSGSQNLMGTSMSVTNSDFLGSASFTGIPFGVNTTPSMTFTGNTVRGLDSATDVFSLFYQSKNPENYTFNVNGNHFSNLYIAQFNINETGGTYADDSGTPTFQIDCVDCGSTSSSSSDPTTTYYTLKISDLDFTNVGSLGIYAQTPHGRTDLSNITYTNDGSVLSYTGTPFVDIEAYSGQGMNLSNITVDSPTAQFIFLDSGYTSAVGADVMNDLTIDTASAYISGKLNMDNVNVTSSGGIYLEDLTDPSTESYIRNSSFKVDTGNIYTQTGFDADQDAAYAGNIAFVANGDAKVYNNVFGTTFTAPVCVGDVCVTSTTGELTDPDLDTTGRAADYWNNGTINSTQDIVFKTAGPLKLNTTTFQVGDTPVVVPPVVTTPDEPVVVPPVVTTPDEPVVVPPVVTTPDQPVVVPPVVTTPDEPVVTIPDVPVVTPPAPIVKTPAQVSTESLNKAQDRGNALLPEVIVLDQAPAREGFVRRVGIWMGLVAPEPIQERIQTEK